MSSTDPIASHGRGGAGNIAPDGRTYTDGEIVREGPLGDQGNGAYSTGVRPFLPPLPPSTPPQKPPTSTNPPSQRGGAGNIDSPSLRPTTDAKTAGDSDVVPETAMKPGAQYENYHVGRGGEGNVHREGKEHEGLGAKAKHLFGGGHHEKREGEGS